jgi:tetrathionate reductase subunit A
VAHVLARGGHFQPESMAYQGEQVANKFPCPLSINNETLATSRSAMTGKRHAGVAVWSPPAFADGTPMRARHSEAEWPLLLVSQKSVLMNSYSIGVNRMRGIHAENPVALNAADAARVGVRTGDKVRITTPGGSCIATVLVRHGVCSGVIAVEHGYGHRELGARAHVIGAASQPHNSALAAGINLNDIGLADPAANGPQPWLDPVVGSAVRQGLPARIERVG